MNAILIDIDARKTIINALDDCSKSCSGQFAEECFRVMQFLQRNKDSELILLARKGDTR